MLSNINMEFIQAFNPLYAVPIVAVIFCAFIVYAFGFKSPVQPPSFDGIEEEKKYTKKRRAKESQKSNKLLQNGKSNGSSVNKSNAVAPSKKKDVSEKIITSEKSSHLEKNTVEKKASKKNKLQNEKKSQQEKKKESVSHDDLNDDGWVQLVSKKGRKNRKRDDISVSETQPNTAAINKAGETNKSDDSSQVEESPKRNTEAQDDATTFNQKQPTPAPTKANSTKEESLISNVEKPKVQNVVIEVPKPDNNSIEKQPSKEATPKGAKVLEESNKSKKKKKKGSEPNLSENEPLGKITSNISDSPAVHAISEIPAPQEITNSNPTVNDFSQVTGKVDVDQQSEVKSSNVAFDELAGLYPETKEQQKKKKRVRRDH